MCERCGYSGCRHDWERWTPKAFGRGYCDAVDKQRPRPPKDQFLASGYMAGYVAGGGKYELKPQAADDRQSRLL